MTREEIMQLAVDKHDARMDRACKAITGTDNLTDARLLLETAVRMHPGVSMDPDTVPDILRLMDTYVSRLTTLPERPDKCWIFGPHVRHKWSDVDGAFACPGQL